MFDYLQIYDRRERWAVGLADVALRALAAPARLRRLPPAGAAPQRVLVLRLERIGDLLMTFEALSVLRASLPSARIDLVVGSWNEPLAHAMAVADGVDPLDAPWLARDQPGASSARLLSRARGWRAQKYDLAINFEPDIRSNLLLWMSGAPRRVGYSTGGGGATLTDAAAYDPTLHTHDNAVRLVDLAMDASSECEPGAGTKRGGSSPGLKTRPASGGSRQPSQTGESPRLQLPDAARERAGRLLVPAAGSMCIGLHASGGRPVKQWHAGRFAELATALGREHGATIVLTGTSHDAAIVREVQAAIPPTVRVLNLCEQADLLDLAAVLERLAVFVTGDTGPMHLAAAVGTPLVALFGPSDPVRYAPRSKRSRIVRVDLPCSPCNRIRLPPERCRGHVPDCLDGITVDDVLAAVRESLSRDPGRGLRGVSPTVTLD
jgi:lipopolysaccharide heptosyltransferase II